MTDLAKKLRARASEITSIHDVSLISQAASAIEQHEAFRQEVSEFASGVQDYMRCCKAMGWDSECNRFIVAKPDMLAEIVEEAWAWRNPDIDVTENLRTALAARGLEIREVGQ